jgi:hypothetical protein
MLRELLEDDRRAGVPWSGADFAQRVHIVCRETRARGWRWILIETLPAWRDAYLNMRPSALEQLGVDLLDDDGERVAVDDVAPDSG